MDDVGTISNDGRVAPAKSDRRSVDVMPRDLVFTYWRETWTDSMRRQFMTPDRLVQTLLGHQRVGRLLIADAYRLAPTQVAWRLLGRRPVPIPSREHETAVVSPLRLRRHDGTGEFHLRRTYRDYDRRLSARARALGLNSPAVITTNPFYAAYGPLQWAGPVTYYAFDDWAAHDHHERWWADYERAYQAIRGRGYRVCAVSRHLLDRLDPTGPGSVVANGIVPAEWRAPGMAPEWLQALPHPRILYTGAIHVRLDVEAVRQVAERFPQGSVIFMGPVMSPEVGRALNLIPGVHVQEPVESRELIAAVTSNVDVCIMPHHRNLLTESMSPLKIYEYCAAGRPVAATDMSPVRGIHSHVVLIQDNRAFADGVEQALALGPIKEDDRQAFIAANSWARRHDAILDLAFAE
jgi:teichuronic acid biosynthesis glycosyltransferase TuaH